MIEKETTHTKRKWLLRVSLALVCAFALCSIGFGVYVSDYYHADTPATELSTAVAPVTETNDTITVGSSTASKGIVFYPGAKVDPAAYVPLMQDLAQDGFYCIIVKMPFNLAFFDINAADGIMAENSIQHWWIAGHSLGGAMAAQYAADNADKLEGIAFLGAYAASDLSSTNLKAVVIYGSNDGVLNRAKLTENEGNLPATTETHVIEGGNHAGFGNYGAQDGDGEATISTEQQQQETAQIIAKSAGLDL